MRLDEAKREIWQLVEPVARAEGLELVDIDLRGGRARPTLTVYLDRPGGVTVDELAAVSRQLGDLLDVHDPIGQPYLLEVSSPGLNRRLSRPEHFQRAVGGKVCVRTREPLGGRSNFVGVVEAAGETGVVIRVPGESESCVIPYGMIRRANYQYDFDAHPIGSGVPRTSGHGPVNPGQEE